MKNIYFVILAGGSGERLWPLSRHARPKQLIPFLDNTSLLEQTLARISPLVACAQQVVVVTNKVHEGAVRDLIGDQVGTIIAEPEGRNTAPAILWACHRIKVMDPQALVVVLPADAYVPDRDAFCELIAHGANYLEREDDIVLFGLQPTYPATGYGYIEADTACSLGEHETFRVVRFCEKPDLLKAQAYVAMGNMLWNIGIFAASVSTFLREFDMHVPDVVTAFGNFMANKNPYAHVPSISIDYAVLEKSSRLVVLPALFEWYDVGNLSVFLSLQERYAQQGSSVINILGQGNLASAHKKLVVCVGVSDLCVVETDDALLIVHQDAVEHVKKAIPEVKKVSAASL
ncbi:MAG: Mannose-6-phosphate isomerase, type 2 [candidate division TM6 bacterium GW2011_GWF2_38_10]|nr:MAG: Mannose-6-phosphate isomerase, type 2 [candidate division TM6 bacterium GW2011_GWF2_38_10]